MLLRRLIQGEQSNAAHHAPPRASVVDDKWRVGGRVHALVRRLFGHLTELLVVFAAVEEDGERLP